MNFCNCERTLIVGHGFYAVYMFSLDVRDKERDLPNRPVKAGRLAARSEQVVGIGSVLWPENVLISMVSDGNT